MHHDRAQDQPLPATAQRLKTAHAAGQVVRSRDLGHFVVVARPALTAVGGQIVSMLWWLVLVLALFAAIDWPLQCGLLEGHTGPGAAGAVMESFGQFLIGGHFTVGFIVFAILVVARVGKEQAVGLLGVVRPGRFLATDPAFELPATWVDEPRREAAQMAGYTVVDSSTVVATHLSHLMQQHAARLLGRTETQALVAHVARRAPQLIQDVIPQMIGIALLQKILQSLLEEGVHVRDMRSIVESLAEQSAVGVTEPGEMVRRLRRTVPRLKVLAFSEIPDTHSIRIGSIIGAQS